MKTLVTSVVLALVATSVALGQVEKTNLETRLALSTNHYEWAQLSKQLRTLGLHVDKTNTSAFVKFQLASLTSVRGAERRDAIASLVSSSGDIRPLLIEGIAHAADPSPIFENAAVANIPIFSMQVLCMMKTNAIAAVPVLIPFIDSFQTDCHASIDGEPRNQVVDTLETITGRSFGTNTLAWTQWWEQQGTPNQ